MMVFLFPRRQRWHLRIKTIWRSFFLTVLSGVHTQLVDTGRGLGQDFNGVAGGVHVVEEVHRQGGEGKD